MKEGTCRSSIVRSPYGTHTIVTRLTAAHGSRSHERARGCIA